MPELPEVETIVRDLQKKVLSRTFIDVWTDTPKIIKRPQDFKEFQKKIKSKRILGVWRRGKNIIFELSGGLSLLIHQKLTGHLLAGKWEKNREWWKPLTRGPLKERVNFYIRLMFWLDNDLMLALSDLRKFAKVELWETSKLESSKKFKELGPEPLSPSFNFEQFKEIIKRKKGKIKQVLMDQKVIAGIGNIYSDEALWRAKIHPLRFAFRLNDRELRSLYQSIKDVLKRSIKLRGESISDFRDLQGKKGFFDNERRVYQREGEKCRRCGSKIKRLKIATRSAHFCPSCQNL